MTNVKFNRKPFEGSLNTLVDDLFTELPALFKTEFNNGERKGLVPVNVKETDKSYQLEVVAPGFEKTDFKLTLDQHLLTISAEKKNEEIKETEKQIRREYSYRSFKRSFTLDEKIDATNIEASYINGVLILNLPKKEVVKASATEIVIK
ncbi:MAG: Hsp20/alpha crystallin family protein [Chitinophagaceae bacterium]|jgi:HSP20 family protein|nr:Hsp20/alpha crystallin family protein [Chitinophagaceae bacterium]MBK7679677.1 Hsp20/alpha crystallin family protein [Chitinophagaceae bacterium]MBK8298970.1 Hsp20/alpha crystallin family protein [Chitinophagaceae bacterium]MBK9464792.1 Hsp20/alpha crystallin family protein [Chitinophagaceae bacterium]MBK9659848.1 Hsp20/alpha crystallin family protein [Chitinophagaceae bacterium]